MTKIISSTKLIILSKFIDLPNFVNFPNIVGLSIFYELSPFSRKIELFLNFSREAIKKEDKFEPLSPDQINQEGLKRF